MRHVSFRWVTLLSCVLGATLVACLVGAPRGLDGPLFDYLIALRARFWAAPPTAPTEPVVVIALDQRSLDAPELAPYPRTFLAPLWATLLESLFAAGARAVGFDVLFAYSANRFLANFDAPFLAALHTYRDRVVLARSATTLPAAPFLAALRYDPGSLGLLDVTPDSDGRLRHIHAHYHTSNGTAPGLAQALLRRAGVASMPPVVVLAPWRHPETQIPTYARIDVLRCAHAAPQSLRSAFAEKIGLVKSRSCAPISLALLPFLNRCRSRY